MLAKYGKTFPPVPAIVATIVAALFAVVLDLTRSGRQRQETASLFLPDVWPSRVSIA